MMEHMEHAIEHQPIHRNAKRHAGWNTWNRWNTQKTPRAYANTHTSRANKNTLTCARPLFHVFHLFYLNKNKRLCDFLPVPSPVLSVPSPVPSQKTTKQGLAMKKNEHRAPNPVARGKPHLNLTHLAPAIKAEVWRAFQQDAPALARLLECEDLLTMQMRWDAEVSVSLDQLPPSALAIIHQHMESA
jgi:hypothetical protein